MKKELSYSSTIGACYLGYVVLAIVINLTPILFVPLQDLYGITFSQLGILISVNFGVQVASDLAFGKPADRFGIRPFVLLAQVATIAGLLVFAFAAELFDDIFIGLLIGTILFSMGGGLLELLLNPIATAVPTEGRKSAAMNLLHSFYSWGQICVIVCTTFLVYFWGEQNWRWIALIWLVIPIINLYMFAKVPLAPLVREGQKQTPLKKILKSRYFVLIIVCIMMGAAAEHVMGEWSSTFLERAAGLPKIVGDVAGVCLFAAMMGVGRVIYYKTGGKHLVRTMTFGAVVACAAYILIAASSNSILTLLACALCGLAVSTMWPGCIVLADQRFPDAGTSMYSLLAANGDTGAAFAPWLVGIVADAIAIGSGEEIGLKVAMFITAVFPAIMVVSMLFLGRKRKTELPKV